MQYFFEIEMFWNKILKVRFFKYFLRSITISNLVCLCSRFLPLGSFYALWKPQKTSGLTMFSRDTERKQWHEMGWLVKLLDLKFSFWNSTFSNMSRWPWLCTSVCVFYYPTLLLESEKRIRHLFTTGKKFAIGTEVEFSENNQLNWLKRSSNPQPLNL